MRGAFCTSSKNGTNKKDSVLAWPNKIKPNLVLSYLSSVINLPGTNLCREGGVHALQRTACNLASA